VNATFRNVVIILVLAALVAIVPGGGTGANTALQAVSLAFLGALGWFAMVMYRQHRSELYSLGDRKRATLYAAAAVAVLTLSATPRLWNTSAGSVAWLVLIGGAAYAAFAVVWSVRKY
jgi:ABC-type phosphonate transport system ATPase subunit